MITTGICTMAAMGLWLVVITVYAINLNIRFKREVERPVTAKQISDEFGVTQTGDRFNRRPSQITEKQKVTE